MRQNRCPILATLAVAASATLFVFALGCGNEPAPKSESPAGQPVAAANPTPAATGAPSSPVAPGAPSSSASIPDDFPKDVPVYPGGRVTAGLSGHGPTGAGASVTLITGDSPEKVLAWYGQMLGADGWKTMLEVPATGGRSGFFKKESKTVNVKASADPAAGTQVQVIVSDESSGGSATSAASPV